MLLIAYALLSCGYVLLFVVTVHHGTPDWRHKTEGGRRAIALEVALLLSSLAVIGWCLWISAFW